MAAEQCPSKKPHLVQKIGTHNGSFHCDEVLACFMLKLLPEYKDAQIIRTRDQAILDTCDIVVDVGAKYDPSTHRYDHHQRSFTETMNSLRPDKKWVTKLSSAGLVYLHFGERVISQLLQTSLDDKMVTIIWDKVYENFMEEVDAIDNGIAVSDAKPRYHTGSGISSRVSHLNPSWNEKGVEEWDRFQKAMDLVGPEFVDRVRYYSTSWWPARDLVVKALNNRFKVDPSGEIVKLELGGCPWKEHLVTLEDDLKLEVKVKFVLFTDQSGKWRVQCVPVEPGSFENRLSLLEEWRGVRGEELSTLSGIPGCIFVHAGGFIGGNETYEGVLEMARRTLQKRT